MASGGRSDPGELPTSFHSPRPFEPDDPVTVYSRFTVPRGLKKCPALPTISNEHPLKLKVLTFKESSYGDTLFPDIDSTVPARSLRFPINWARLTLPWPIPLNTTGRCSPAE